MRHTPGPWQAVLVRDTTDRGQPEPDRWEIVAVDGTEVVSTALDRDYYFPMGGILNQDDARLIAMAPAMFEALKKISDTLPETVRSAPRLWLEQCVSIARKALAGINGAIENTESEHANG